MLCRYEKVWDLSDMPPKPLAAEHHFILKAPFVWDCLQTSFQDGEIGWLSRYGSWCRALMCGEIEPLTKDQRRFVVIANDKRRPFRLLPHEGLWQKYLAACLKQGGSFSHENVYESKPGLLGSLNSYTEELDSDIKEGIMPGGDSAYGAFVSHSETEIFQYLLSLKNLPTHPQ